MSESDPLRINNPFQASEVTTTSGSRSSRDSRSGTNFGDVLSAGVSVVPGGSLVSTIARGAANLLGGGGGRNEQVDDMWAMQAESQFFNMEYMALQESAQSENRHFSSLSNLMKARHDTAKSAISNLRV